MKKNEYKTNLLKTLFYTLNCEKYVRMGCGRELVFVDFRSGTFLHLNAGSGHRPHGGHGGHLPFVGHTLISGHLGHTGGTIDDFKTYKSSSPFGICDGGIPG